MTLLAEVLAANAAVADGSDVPVPAVPDNCRVVVVACSEIRCPGGRDLAALLGFAPDDAFVVANAGGRVQTLDGDVVRSVGAAIAAAGRGEVFVIAHENCEFQQSDPEALAALVPAGYSTAIASVETLCGADFVSARQLAIASAQTLRTSPFLPRGVAVHALVLNVARSRLSVEEEGYGRSSVAAAAGAGLLAAPSPILSAGPAAGSSTAQLTPVGAVSLMGSAPSPLLGAPSPLLAASPSALGGVGSSSSSASAFLSAPGPAFLVAGPRPAGPPIDVPPPPPTASPPLTFGAPPAAQIAALVGQMSVEPQTAPAPTPSQEPPARDPAPSESAKPADRDDPFRRANEVLERLRRERRSK